MQAALTAFVLVPALAQNVATIDGRQYPQGEFSLSGADVGCAGNHHHAANGSFATALDSTTLFDPDPFGCGFGLLTFAPLAAAGPAAASEPLSEPTAADLFLAGLGFYTNEAAGALPPDPRTTPLTDGAGPAPYDLAAAGEDLNGGADDFGALGIGGGPVVGFDSGPLVLSGDTAIILGPDAVVAPPRPNDSAEAETFVDVTVEELEDLDKLLTDFGPGTTTMGLLDSDYIDRQGENFTLNGVVMNGGELNYYWFGFYCRLVGHYEATAVAMAHLYNLGKGINSESTESSHFATEGQTAATRAGYEAADAAIDYDETHTTEEAEQLFRDATGRDDLPRVGNHVSIGVTAHAAAHPPAIAPAP